MTTRELFASNLKVLRAWYGWSQDVAANDVGVKRTSYSGYENGTTEPSIETLAAMQRCMKVGLDVLLTTDLSKLTQYTLRRMIELNGVREPESKPVLTEL